MNETLNPQPIIEAANTTDLHATMVLMLIALSMFLLGLFVGAAAGRPSIPRARIRLRALKAYQDPNRDELVSSLLSKDIRSLESRLNLDSDE